MSKGRLTLLLLLAAGLGYYYLRPAPVGISNDAVRRPVLAVLVFESPTQQPELDFLGNALARDMIAKIGQLCSKGVDIVAHASVTSYRKTHKPLSQIGRELGVDYILEGAAQMDGDQLQVTVWLTRVSDLAQLWKERYECSLSETSRIQNQIIAKIAESLNLPINPDELQAMDRATTTNAVAREAYMRGEDQCASGAAPDSKSCVASLEAAVHADPKYPRALASLAAAELSLTQDDINAEKHARAALETAEATPQAHIVMGQILHEYRRDDVGAEKEFRRAIDLNQSDADAYLKYAAFLLDKNRLEEAQVQVQRALALDPFSVPPSLMAGRILTAARMYDRAIEQLEHTVGLNRDLPNVRFYLAEAYLARGMVNDAIREFQNALSYGGAVPEYVEGLGEAYVAAHRLPEAQMELTQLKDMTRKRRVPPELIQGLSEKIQ